MQQELEFRIQDQALRTSIASQRQELDKQKHLQGLAEENARLENERNDAAGLNAFASAISQINSLEDADSFMEQQTGLLSSLSSEGSEAARKMFLDFRKGKEMERMQEIADLRSEVMGFDGADQDAVGKMNYGQLLQEKGQLMLNRPWMPNEKTRTAYVNGQQVTLTNPRFNGGSGDGYTPANRMSAFDDFQRALRAMDEIDEGEYDETEGKKKLTAADDRARAALRRFASIGGSRDWLTELQLDQYGDVFESVGMGAPADESTAKERLTVDGDVPPDLFGDPKRLEQLNAFILEATK